MTSKEFVAFLKGIALVIEDSPNEKQWKSITDTLMKVQDKREGASKLNEIKPKDERKPLPNLKKTPGAPPDIYM